jgi:hypothetical protein
MIKKYLLYIILILLVIYLLKYNDFNKYEYYDGVVRNISSIEDCADITSSIYDVGAFAYDPSNTNCFPSKTSLTRPPIQIHPYHNDFKVTDIICNKTLYAKNSELNFDQIIIGNRLYECYNNDSKIKNNIDVYYFQKNKPKQLITRQNIAELPFTKHNFFNIDWPINKDEMNDIKVKLIKKQINKNIPTETENIIESINWSPKIERKILLDEETKLDYGYEYKYPILGCIN